MSIPFLITKSEPDPKSVHCDQYRGQVLEEEAPFSSPSRKSKRSALGGVLCVVDFPRKEVVGKLTQGWSDFELKDGKLT
jgi:hypothetical protein